MHTSQLLTAAETAALLGITAARVRQLCQAGAIKHVKTSRIYLIRVEDVPLARDWPRGKCGWPEGRKRPKRRVKRTRTVA